MGLSIDVAGSLLLLYASPLLRLALARRTRTVTLAALLPFRPWHI